MEPLAQDVLHQYAKREQLFDCPAFQPLFSFVRHDAPPTIMSRSYEQDRSDVMVNRTLARDHRAFGARRTESLQQQFN